jgi:pimeloyl-ACP methyl ester carboxylesterase
MFYFLIKYIMKFDKDIRMGKYDSRPPTVPASEKIVYKAAQPPPSTQTPTDKEGLDKAYASDNKIHVEGNTMYVAGASSAGDWLDTLKIPLGRTAEAQRYKDADALLSKNPQITNLVGHSLGGSSILELQKNHGEKTFSTNTYNAPVTSIVRPDNINNHRYRNFGDPFSALDRQAETKFKPSAAIHFARAYQDGDAKEFWNGVLDAHSYENFDNTKVNNGGEIPYITDINTF